MHVDMVFAAPVQCVKWVHRAKLSDYTTGNTILQRWEGVFSDLTEFYRDKNGLRFTGYGLRREYYVHIIC